MRSGVVAFVVVLASLGALAAQHGIPYPPGVRQADNAVRAGMQLEAPTIAPPRGAGVAKLQREAAQLNQLAALVQKQIGTLSQGQLARDLPKNLKQIERLAHELGLQLSR